MIPALPVRDAQGTGPVKVTLLRDLPQEGRFSIERYATELEEALRDRDGIEAKGFVFGGFETTDAVRRTAADRIIRFGLYPLAARRLTADVLHIVDHGYADLLLQLPAERTIITCHDLTPIEAAISGAAFGSTSRLATTRLRLTMRLFSDAAHIVCVSEATRDSVLRLARTDPARTSVVRSGVHPRFAPLSPKRRAELRAELPPADCLLLTVSSSLPRKNTPTTLRVLHRLREQGRDVVLLRVGPELSPADQLLADRLGVDRSIVGLGRVPDAELVEAYGVADAMLFPSLHEGFGWPVVEAMACGTPVVTSDIAVLRETAGDAALLAGATDVQGLSAAICSLVDEPAVAARQRERGLRRAASLSWEATASGYATIYRAVAAEADATPTRRRASFRKGRR